MAVFLYFDDFSAAYIFCIGGEQCRKGICMKKENHRENSGENRGNEEKRQEAGKVRPGNSGTRGKKQQNPEQRLKPSGQKMRSTEIKRKSKKSATGDTPSGRSVREGSANTPSGRSAAQPGGKGNPVSGSPTRQRTGALPGNAAGRRAETASGESAGRRTGALPGNAAGQRTGAAAGKAAVGSPAGQGKKRRHSKERVPPSSSPVRKGRKREADRQKEQSKGMDSLQKTWWERLENAGEQLSKKSKKINKKRVKTLLLWTVEISAACLLAFVLVFFYGQRVSNAGDSMSPVLKNGDVVLVDRVIYNAMKPKRGDVIVFKPGGNKNAHYMIKRVAGLPGETIQIKDGAVYIDGRECTEGIYASDILTPGVAEEPLELGENEYFVIGDNHAGSDDSRMADVGNVKREDIFGKAWFIVNFGEDFGFIKSGE